MPTEDLPETQMRDAVLRGAEDWRTVGEIVTTSSSRPEAVRRLRAELDVSEVGAQAILDQPLHRWLPEQLTHLREQ